jgi:ABC-type branched-subunit amino acid transport system substrate-binding protein
MHLPKKLLVSAAIAALVPFAAACGGGTAKSKSDVGGAAYKLTIGDIEAYTGDLGVLGQPIDLAVKLAAQQSTAAAGEAGAKISVNVTTSDTQSDPQTAVSAARKVVDAGATCLTGPITTPEATAVLNSVTKVRGMTMIPTATSTKLTPIADDDTIFRTSPPDSLQARALIAGVEAQLGGAKGKTVSLAYQNSPYGQGLADTFAAAWKAKGGRVSGSIGYDPTQASFDSEAGKIVAGNPDAYVIADYPDTFGKLGAALLRTGKFDAKRLFVPDALAVSPVPKGIPAQALEGAHGTRAGVPTDTPQSKAFDALYKKAAGGKRATLDANSFDAGILCFLASVSAGSHDAKAITAQMREVAGPPGKKVTYLDLADAVKTLRSGGKIDYQGVSGPIDFDQHGDPTTGLYDLFHFAGGKLVVDRQINASTGGGG